MNRNEASASEEEAIKRVKRSGAVALLALSLQNKLTATAEQSMDQSSSTAAAAGVCSMNA